MKIKTIPFGKTFVKNGKQYKLTGTEITPIDAVVIAEDMNGKIVAFDIEDETDILCGSYSRIHCEICPHLGKDCPEW